MAGSVLDGADLARGKVLAALGGGSAIGSLCNAGELYTSIRVCLMRIPGPILT